MKSVWLEAASKSIFFFLCRDFLKIWWKGGTRARATEDPLDFGGILESRSCYVRVRVVVEIGLG